MLKQLFSSFKKRCIEEILIRHINQSGLVLDKIPQCLRIELHKGNIGLLHLWGEPTFVEITLDDYCARFYMFDVVERIDEYGVKYLGVDTDYVRTQHTVSYSVIEQFDKSGLNYIDFIVPQLKSNFVWKL